MSFFFSALNILLVSTLLSQTGSITGVIINNNDGIPIHGANIYVQNSDKGAISRVDGGFTLNDISNGQLRIIISMIGYKNVKKDILLYNKQYDFGTIKMLTDTILIKEIVVEAHTELKPKSFSSNIELSGKRYHINLGSSLASSLDDEVGLAIRTMGQGTNQPVLRGYSGDRFLLTDDGLSIGDLSTSSPDHSVSVDMASFKKVRIIRGPESLLYGSNTIGGVINISRNNNSETRFSKRNIQSIFGIESHNESLFGSVSGYFPVKKNQQLMISYLKRNSGNQTSPIGELKNTELSNTEIVTGYDYFGNDYRATISFEEIDMEYGIPGTEEGHISGVNIDMKKRTQKFNVHKDINFSGFQTIDLDQRFIDYGHTESVSGFNFASVYMDQTIFSLQSKLTGESLTLGSFYQFRDFRAGGFYWTPDSRATSLGSFFLFEKNIKKVTLQVSSRATYQSIKPDKSNSFTSNLNSDEIIDRKFLILSHAVGAYYNLNNWKVSLGTMYTQKAPSLDDLYSDGPHLGTYSYEIGSPKLNLEKTIGLESSLDYVSRNLGVKITGYYNYSPNYHIYTKLGDGYEPGADWIEWGSGSSGWLYKYERQGLKAIIYGYEGDFEYTVTKNIVFGTKLSITRGDNLENKLPIQYIPPDKIFFTSKFDLNPLYIELQLKLVSDQSRIGEYEEKTKGYSISNIIGTYNINAANISHKLVFRLENIFNREYYNHLSKIKSIMPEKGRTIGIQYRVIF